MEPKKITELITSEILSTEGFINIDETDINWVINNSDYIDAATIDISDTKLIDAQLKEIFNSLIAAHDKVFLTSFLFVVKMNPSGNLNMPALDSLNNFISTLETVDVIWGVATDDKIEDNSCRVIAITGFKKG